MHPAFDFIYQMQMYMLNLWNKFNKITLKIEQFF